MPTMPSVAEQLWNINNKSVNSDVESDVRFINMTSHIVDVYWIDFNVSYIILPNHQSPSVYCHMCVQGALVRYATLEPRDGYDQQTYITHPWLFVCPVAGDLIACAFDEATLRLPKKLFLPLYANVNDAGESVTHTVYILNRRVCCTMLIANLIRSNLVLSLTALCTRVIRNHIQRHHHNVVDEATIDTLYLPTVLSLTLLRKCKRFYDFHALVTVNN
jgi:hypothetical protein